MNKQTAGGIEMTTGGPDTTVIFCCDDCTHRAGLKPKRPADSGKHSLPCGACGHRGIGSRMVCKVGKWLELTPIAIAREESK